MDVKTKPYLLTAGVVVLVIGIIIGTYILLEKTGGKPENNSIAEREPNTTVEILNMIENVTSMAIETTETKEKLNQNAKPNLVVGEEWAYDVVMSDSETGEKTSIIVTYNIEKIERVNKSDCYVIHAKAHHLSESSQDDEYVIYITKDNGELIKATMESMVPDEKGTLVPYQIDLDPSIAETGFYGGFLIGDFMLQRWMLSLSKDFKWRTYSNTTINEKHIEEIFEYEVKDIESVNGKKCFKVEIRAFNVEGGASRTTIRKILWVDIDNRVLVKAITYLRDNVKVIEVNLNERTRTI